MTQVVGGMSSKGECFIEQLRKPFKEWAMYSSWSWGEKTPHSLLSQEAVFTLNRKKSCGL